MMIRVLPILLLAFGLLLADAHASPLDAGNGRVILVGDSITGHSRNRRDGYAHRMEQALKSAHPGSTPEIIALGGSGQSVSSWAGVEKRSREAAVTLDIKGIDAHEALSQPADLLIIMLGMNDVIAPYVSEDENSLDRWSGQYETLIAALRERVHPKELALASIPLCTEDLHSPKNRLIAVMNDRVKALAAKEKARYLPVFETMAETLRKGRDLRPDFNLSPDFVHPAGAGHLAIAIAMLRGIGEEDAARWLDENPLKTALDQAAKDQPGLSWELMESRRIAEGDRFEFRVRYAWQGTEDGIAVRLIAPEGWSAEPAEAKGNRGEFVLTGTPEKMTSRFRLEGTAGGEKRSVEGAIAAPWLVAAGLVEPAWENNELNEAKAHTGIDTAIEAGQPFLDLPPASGKEPLKWMAYVPTLNFMGGGSPGNIDFSAITHARTFEAGYAVRWIYSPQEREWPLELATRIFAGNVHLRVWLNGASVYNGQINKEQGRKTRRTVTLRKGWNELAVKSNHRAWLWQYSLDFISPEGAAADDLLVRITPPPSTP